MTRKHKRLLSDFPNVDPAAMGFPHGWEEEPLWSNPLTAKGDEGDEAMRRRMDDL